MFAIFAVCFVYMIPFSTIWYTFTEVNTKTNPSGLSLACACELRLQVKVGVVSVIRGILDPVVVLPIK